MSDENFYQLEKGVEGVEVAESILKKKQIGFSEWVFHF